MDIQYPTGNLGRFKFLKANDTEIVTFDHITLWWSIPLSLHFFPLETQCLEEEL